MNRFVAWALAVAAIAAGFVGWGWPGVVLAVTVVVFWMLLQFSRALRVLKNAGSAPVGQVDSVVMLHSKLKTGMSLMQVLGLTRSLGTRLSESPERWGWADAGGAQVELELHDGKLVTWTLQRGPEQADPPAF